MTVNCDLNQDSQPKHAIFKFCKNEILKTSKCWCFSVKGYVWREWRDKLIKNSQSTMSSAVYLQSIQISTSSVCYGCRLSTYFLKLKINNIHIACKLLKDSLN